MIYNQDNEVNGINETLLDKLIIEVCDKSDDLKSILYAIDNEFEICTNGINCSAINQFKHVYNEMKKNYIRINENILSYGNDYAKVKNAYYERGSSITKQIENITENVQQMDKYEERR